MILIEILSATSEWGLVAVIVFHAGTSLGGLRSRPQNGAPTGGLFVTLRARSHTRFSAPGAEFGV